MSPLALAFVGDAVLELLVRARGWWSTTRLQPGRLHTVATQLCQRPGPESWSWR